MIDGDGNSRLANVLSLNSNDGGDDNDDDDSDDNGDNNDEDDYDHNDYDDDAYTDTKVVLMMLIEIMIVGMKDAEDNVNSRM